MLRPLIDKGLIDGMGLQSHVGMDAPRIKDYAEAIREYADTGLALEVTELDVKSTDASPEGQAALARRYRELFETYVACPGIDSVTFWGVSDAQSWLSRPDAPMYPLLFDRESRPKPAYDAVCGVIRA